MSRRTRQVGDLLREELSDIVRTEMSDPRVGFFTITRVDVSSDLRTAVAMVSVLGSDDERSETVAALRSASGFIRRHLKPRLRMRQIPDLIFEDDRSMEHAQLIASALAEIEKEHPSDRAGPEPQE
jgi:ribosome-binding factor A